ncbi:GCN5-related protein N-acetyltransferase [Beutenbergia cavernae DSM 12333]|uniref:GCN5-related protein N-acetyltransferase n=1 Tax=Beutenbergia cavernae (strain ATCC BAA-8 / DSM 12333 / CCUG 43141 / JCM 11478 / NBRC 16432 / NCIMB 13614 / HKI 0122) TaxID=471853 RepID=C5BXB9_BEUC1|nr:GNAT family N-acetyltransferase [Beutenbergia cavernae]ACQ78794.1 GCN5-related protein N-acetyltransferase [Beutenbergia cavernae DSM 12333]
MTPDVHIRHAAPADRDALYHVCLLTGNSGKDGRELYADPEILGHRFAGPYLALEPDFAFVAEDSEGVAGYVLGAPDSAAFEARLERDWWPDLRERYPDPGDVDSDVRPRDPVIAHSFHHPPATDPGLLERYPAHLHIDLLPRLQGKGAGRGLMTTLLDALRAAGIPGVHLGVGAANTNAIGYYEHMGFHTVFESVNGRTMAMDLRTTG